MAKSKNGCLKILACAGAGSDPSAGSDADGDEHADENKSISDKSRWSFRRRSTRHRVLKNSDISEPETLSSSKAKADIAPSNNIYSSTYSYASEKSLHQDKPDENILHQENSDEKPLHDEKLDDKPAEKPVEKAIDTPVEKPADQIIEKSIEHPDEKVTEMPMEDPAERISEKPNEQPTKIAVEEFDEKPDENISFSSSELKQDEASSFTDGNGADHEEDHVESAAIVIQSGIRTYIARQELSNHKDLVKLQAVVRGHIVRRQAAESLQCLIAIVKMQGLVRARQTQQSAGKFQSIAVRSSSEKLLQNEFALKLMHSVSNSKPIHIKCDPSQSDATWEWMERWSALIPSTTWDLLENTENSGLVVEKVKEDAQHEEKGVPLNSDITFPKLVPDDVEETLNPSDTSALEVPAYVSEKTHVMEIEDNPVPDLIEKINEDAEQFVDPKAQNVVEQSLELSSQQSIQTDPTKEEPSSLPEKTESSNEDIMDGCKAEQTLDMEGKRGAARKSCNPAFAAAQLKFEELSLNSTASRSNSSSYMDGTSKSKVHTPQSQDDVSSKQHNGTGIPESSVGNDPKIILAASECGTEISISSTLDSPDRSEADGGEIVLEIGALEDREYVADNSEDSHVLHSEVKNSSEEAVQPEQEEEHNDGVANPVVAMDPVLPEQPHIGLKNPDLHEQPDKSVESYAKSPEGTPMSRTTFAESHGTPSSEVSVNTKRTKSKKPRSHVSRRSLNSPSSDSVGRSSTDNLSKDYKHAKRESSTKVTKSDNADQEPRMSNSTPLPSYMQFTESARAKASASVSPKLSPDVQDNNTRKRHSLPMTNGKQESSPRMQRSSSQAQQNVKSNVAVPHNSSDRRWHI